MKPIAMQMNNITKKIKEGEKKSPIQEMQTVAA